MTSELDFLRALEQQLQQLHERVRRGYSGAPEVTALKRDVNQRIIELLERSTSNQHHERKGGAEG